MLGVIVLLLLVGEGSVIEVLKRLLAAVVIANERGDSSFFASHRFRATLTSQLGS